MTTQRFFVPGKGYGEQSDLAYQGLARTFDVTAIDPRISGLAWKHNGMKIIAEVGSPLPKYFLTGEEPVLAIFDRGDHFIICTDSRGESTRIPVYAGKSGCSKINYFDRAVA